MCRRSAGRPLQLLARLRVPPDRHQSPMGAARAARPTNALSRLAAVQSPPYDGTKDLTDRLPAGKIISLLAPKVGGKGGGKPDIAEGGGSDVSALSSALASAPDVIRELLGKTALSV